MSYRDVREKCDKCKKEFIAHIDTLPCKMEEGKNWTTYFICPHCHQGTGEIVLSSDEEIFKYTKL